MSSLYILWDESHIWGLLAWRAVSAMGLPHRLVQGAEIAQGLLSRKPPAALVAPGGVARRKAASLGESGMQAVRDYIEAGGNYVGFCGGSGLGLSGTFGLQLCPWQRAALKDRMLHLVSGHISTHVQRPHPLAPPESDACPQDPLLPVWWPARFAMERDTPVSVLATYDTPGKDFWVADLAVNSLPAGTLAQWETLYDVTLRPATMQGQPCVISGHSGKGRYLLSYAHLETPGSPHANAWLAHILTTFLQSPPITPSLVPAWDLAQLPLTWQDPLLLEAKETLESLLELGREHFLLFARNPWLMGWRAGIPGAALNNMHSLLRQTLAQEPTEEARKHLDEHRSAFAAALQEFRQGVSGYLLAERLAMTLAKTFPEAVSQEALKRQKAALFGEPMEYAGPYGVLLTTLDALFYRCVRGREMEISASFTGNGSPGDVHAQP